MAQWANRGDRSMVGDYVVGKQVGSGSYSTVWHARHRVHGTEVAIKEVVTAGLEPKLRESLKSEISILKKISHPNIIRLHDMIEEPGKIYIILEYCRGGDLSVYVQKHHGKIPEATAKHFMQQLASGLQCLRENNLIHRDLKPQNLLLSADDDKSILKIADFGFARSLQPSTLAATVCGSPLYMAPEVMQKQKYDAKADLWSVGAILYHLVIGKTPYTGMNDTQLLENIRKNELKFPPDTKDISPLCLDLCWKLLRRYPVERLTFEEFFNHPFLSHKLPDGLSRNMTPLRVIDGFPLSHANPVRNAEESFQEDSLPFILDDDCSGPDRTPTFDRRLPLRSTYGFSLPENFDGNGFVNASNKMDTTSDYRGIQHISRTQKLNCGGPKLPEGKTKESFNIMDIEVAKIQPKVLDSLELIDQDYVLVSSPPLDVSSMLSTCKLSNLQSKSGSRLKLHGSANHATAPMPIVGTAAVRGNQFEIFESCGSAPGTSPRSADMSGALEHELFNSMTRIRTLERCASAISELVKEKIEAGKHLEAFSVQLLILSIWKQVLHIRHMTSASDVEGSPTRHRIEEIIEEKASHNNQKHGGGSTNAISKDFCSQTEGTFLHEVGLAEELAKVLEPGNTEMPDAMETIFQCALALGRRGGVDEYMGKNDSALVLYSKAVNLFRFLLVEAPALTLNPPFSLSNSDRFRLQNYIDILTNRQSISTSERMAKLKSDTINIPSETAGR